MARPIGPKRSFTIGRGRTPTSSRWSSPSATRPMRGTLMFIPGCRSNAITISLMAIAGCRLVRSTFLRTNSHAVRRHAWPRCRSTSPIRCVGFLVERSLPCGTMYGLSGDFLRRLTADNIRMPVGFIGDDNLVASLVKSNLDDRFGDFVHSRVRVVDRIGPVANRPPPFSWAAMRLQRRRLRRYALRSVQRELLNIHVWQHGLRTLPATARELSPHWRKLGLRWYFRWRGLETPYIWRALWQVSREAHALTRTARCLP